MAELCPQTGKKLAPVLHCHNELGEWLFDVRGDQQAAEWIASGAYLPTGSKGRITHLVKLAPDKRLLAADSIQRPPATCRAENLDGYRVYAHTSTAHTWREVLDRASVDDAFAMVRRLKRENRKKQHHARIKAVG